MFHHSKLITMFAVLNNLYVSDASRTLAFIVQAFFMPGHKVYHIWYPCTSVWNCNGTTDIRNELLSSGKGTDTFILKTVCLCLTTRKLSTLRIVASKRPPTKRVVNLLSPLPAILTPILPLTASTFTDAPSATGVQPIQKATPSPDDSTSPDVKKLPVQPATKPLLPSLLINRRSIAVTWQNARSVSVSAISRLGNHIILNSHSTIVTSPLCSHLSKLVNYYSCTAYYKRRLCRNSTPQKLIQKKKVLR